MQVTNTSEPLFFVAVDKVEAIAGNLAAWSKLVPQKVTAKQRTAEAS